MSLDAQMYGNRSRVAAIEIAPLDILNQQIAYGNRFIANITQIVPVQDIALVTQRPNQVPRDLQAVYNSPNPFEFLNGAAATAGNNTPGRKGG